VPLDGLCALRRFISFSGRTGGAKKKLASVRETSQNILHSSMCRVGISKEMEKEDRKETLGLRELFLESLAWLTERRRKGARTPRLERNLHVFPLPPLNCV
jgi:hypothetical protein